MTGLLTQHVLRVLNVPVSSTDTEAERALSGYRPITNWCVLETRYLKNPLKSSVQRHGMVTCMSI